MTYTLPTTVEINGHEYAVRSDFRAILDILEAVNDVELDGQKRAAVMLSVFYPDFESMPASDYEGAITKCLWFINCGQMEDKSKKPKKLVDWQQDFSVIVAPVNRVMGRRYGSWITCTGGRLSGRIRKSETVCLLKLWESGRSLPMAKHWIRAKRNFTAATEIL